MIFVFSFQRLTVSEFFDYFPYLRYVFARFYRLDQLFVKSIGSLSVNILFNVFEIWIDAVPFG